MAGAAGSGGSRQGAVGGQYPNRSDLRTPGQHITPSNLPASQSYGQGVQQARALSVVPTPGPRTGTPSSGSSNQNPSQQVLLGPGDVPSLADPSANPNEPVTAGLPIGPGPGSESLAIAQQDSPELGILRGLFLEYPNPDIRRFMAYLEDTLQF